MKKILFLSLLLLCHSSTLFSQTGPGLFIGGGTTWYYGDMNDRLLTHPRLFRYYFTGGILYRFSPRIYVAAAFAAGRVVGADSLAIQDFNRKRNLNFTNDIWHANLRLEYRLLGLKGNKGRRVTPYVFAGAGYFHFNPKATYDDVEYELQPLGTEGQYIDGGGYPEPYELYGFSFPLGIGVEFKLTEAFALRLEIANHFTLTDYFDDVSTSYADSTRLATTPNGPLAVLVASNLPNRYPVEGFGRGDPKQNDNYAFAGITLLWKPGEGSGGGRGKGGYSGGGKGRKKKKANCPAFD
jgi:hypothetical protein